MRYRIYSASSLTDSLRSVVRLRRAVQPCERGGSVLENARTILSNEEQRPRRCRFSIGSAPLISITESDAHISGGETRQDYKDTRRFPLVAPSCAFLFPSCGIRVVVEALPKSPRPVPFRQFAPSWAVCKNPPFSPTAAPVPVTIDLSPIRKDTTKRHWQQPLVTDLEELVLKLLVS